MPANICSVLFLRFLMGVVQNNGDLSFAFIVSNVSVAPKHLRISPAYLFFRASDSPYHDTISDMAAQAENDRMLCLDFIYIANVAYPPPLYPITYIRFLSTCIFFKAESMDSSISEITNSLQQAFGWLFTPLKSGNM